jgi:uncharacterized integral membrane protein
MNFRTPFAILRWLVILAMALLALVFALKNNHMATMYLLTGIVWEAKLSVIILLSVITGFVMGFSAGGLSVFRFYRSRHKKLKLKNTTNTSSAPAFTESSANATQPATPLPANIPLLPSA